MDAFSAYALPIQGLKTGIRQLEYNLDAEFFSLFEDSPIEVAQIKALLMLDKRPSMMVFEFDVSGEAQSACDRCLADIMVPVEGQHRLVVKFNEEAATEEENDDDEVVFISPKDSTFNVAPYLYEFAVLSLPFNSRIDCEAEKNPPCDFETLERLDAETAKTKKSVWDALKGLNLDN